MRLRRAQLAELTRLERGAAPAGHSRAALTGELERAGVDVDRARDALAAAALPPAALARGRAADLREMDAAGRRDRRERAGGAALGLLVGAAVAAAVAVVAGGLGGAG